MADFVSNRQAHKFEQSCVFCLLSIRLEVVVDLSCGEVDLRAQETAVGYRVSDWGFEVWDFGSLVNGDFAGFGLTVGVGV